MTTLEATNKALAILGVAPVSAVTQGTHNARVMNRLFEQARQSVLSDFPWKIALERAFLDNPDVVTDRNDWHFVYDLTFNFVWIWEVYRDNNIMCQFAIEDDLLYTNWNKITVEYSKNVVFESWDYAMQEAFVYKLASDAAITLSGSEQLSQAMLQKYQLYGQLAKRNTRNERNTDHVHSGSYLTVREPWTRGYWR